MPTSILSEAKNALRRKCQPDHPVYVRQTKVNKDTLGECSFNEDSKRFNIRIDKKLSVQHKLGILIHEWAHTLTWFTDRVDDHSSAWGIAYAKCYRAVHGNERSDLRD